MAILDRVGIAGLIILAGVTLYWTFTRARLVFLQSRATGKQADAGLAEFRQGVPAILYFTTPDCVPCRMAQTPAIEQVRAEYGDRIQVIAVNAAEDRTIADRWGVLSVPTTFILDGHAQPVHANNGVVPAVKLKRQLHELVNE